MIHIRPATPDDAPALLAIYAPYVTDTAITFEYEVPALSDFRQRIEATLRTHPYLVLERDGEILGYAYTGQLTHGRRRRASTCGRTAAAVVWAPGCIMRWRTPPAPSMCRCCTPALPPPPGLTTHT